MAKKKTAKKPVVKKVSKKAAKKSVEKAAKKTVAKKASKKADKKSAKKMSGKKGGQGEELKMSEHAEAGTFAFLTKYRCPRCGATDTLATSTKGDVQYRKCQRPVCRFKFSVRGTEI